MKILPPHQLSTGDRLWWLLDAGGLVIQEPGTEPRARCTRCDEVSGPLDSLLALGAFLHANAGPTCNSNSAPTGARRKR